MLYDDEDDLSEEYCTRVKCFACYGFMPESYEPRGYGCDSMERWVVKWHGLIRIKPKRIQ